MDRIDIVLFIIRSAIIETNQPFGNISREQQAVYDHAKQRCVYNAKDAG